MQTPAGCFVSVALLQDLSCFLPQGYGQRKSQHVGFTLARSQLWSQAGNSTLALCVLGPVLCDSGDASTVVAVVVLLVLLLVAVVTMLMLLALLTVMALRGAGCSSHGGSDGVGGSFSCSQAL